MNDKNKFSLEIERIVKGDNISYVDAIAEYCSRSGVEIETAAKLCDKKLKEKIKIEAIENRQIKEF